MDSSTTAAQFMSRGLDADVHKTVLYPPTPTYGCLGMVSWCLPDASFPASTLLDKPHCEPSCEPPSDYFFLARSAFSGLQNPEIDPNWPAPHAYTFEVPFPTISGTMGSDSGAWTGEAGADKTIQVGVPNGQDSSSSSPMDASSSIHAKRPSLEESFPPATLLSSLTTSIPKPATTRPRSRTGKHNIQLRTASRKSPKASPSSGSPTSPTESANNGSASDPDDELTPEERRARRSHNRVEKQYRNRLNNQFERLLAVLPLDQHRKGTGVHDGNGYSSDEKRMSKAEVLDLATRRIKALEVDRERLQKEREEILRNIDVMAVAVKGAHQKP